MDKVRVVSAFPGVGKSWITVKRKDISDSDSSKFSKNAAWPNNYISHIKTRLEAGWKVLVSSHLAVREALKHEKIPFVLVYPDRSLKDEYMMRYIKRRNPQTFIDAMSENWDKFIDECEHHTGPKIKLHTGQYLADVIDDILE